MLGRDTEWRQGNLLSDDSAHALGLVESTSSRRRVVVISHDCDLPNNAEEFVEVIVGTELDTSDAMLENARNPRRLHISFTNELREQLRIELQHINRKHVPKSEFAYNGVGDLNFTLSTDQKRALKQWLAARYGRPAFPNAFETRLRKQARGKSVEQRIARILEPASSHLVALLFDLGEDRECEHPDGEAYFLSISVVYDSTEGGQLAREAADNAACELRALFNEAYGTPDMATEIALESCNAVADTFVSLADLRKVDQWRLEYISLREDPVSSFISTGENIV